MAQPLEELIDLPDDQVSIPIIHLAFHSCLRLKFQKIFYSNRHMNASKTQMHIK